ncbi:L-2,4-diaminobutyrate decarboxylase [Halarchaeum rubridurum]|uniref:Aspartate aminotransferase family protein n=1 Tax=Halarchaeum rubridurum TaxID=489911 RepID=A0A830G457_9EURY|nr:aspartate aminotransferase family protein [Halarchaeum rubridurum]MBP1955796.1 L-2,4-diaminobutyrate decarboxylase [Halarchaeum rubridurum]GGM74420.1 aspartate aminotransferase family protein [Halarchaeum rubridurum]
MKPDDLDERFLGTEAGERAYRAATERAVDAAVDATDTEEPFSGVEPDAVRAALPDDVLPESGVGLDAAIDEVADDVLSNTVNASHPRTAAHLHCPPMVPGLAAETMVAATNQSLDSYDQSGAATVVEERLVGTLGDLFGLDEGADGVVTSGGTQSNFQALLLARDRYCLERFDHDVQAAGLPSEAEDLRLVCSAEAHFTGEQSAHHLGLGHDAVVTVETDDDHRMDADALDETLARLDADGKEVFAVVGTAGTTDFGAIDPLDALAERAAAHDAWFHVDAAFGGALALTDDADRLAGVERADSVSVDFHKLFFQPISCGALLVAERGEFGYAARNDDYLNPADSALPNLVWKSTQTTRRFDALKPYLAFRALGREGFETVVETVLTTANRAATLLDSSPDFTLLAEPSLNTVLFRYEPRELSDDDLDALNTAAREALFRDGRAVLARTEVDGVEALKLTLMNPLTTLDDVADTLDALRDVAEDIDAGTLTARDA